MLVCDFRTHYALTFAGSMEFEEQISSNNFFINTTY